MRPPRKITIELLSPDNKRVLQRATFDVPKGRRFTGHGIDRILAQFSDDVVAKFPGSNYRIVTLVGHRYRFVNKPLEPKEIIIQAHGIAAPA